MFGGGSRLWVGVFRNRDEGPRLGSRGQVLEVEYRAILCLYSQCSTFWL